MSRQGLRALLESFQADAAQEELARRPAPRLRPSPGLDGEWADLFAPEAAAEAAAWPGAERWLPFLAAGRIRRDRSEGRRELHRLLASGDRGHLRAAGELAADLAGPPPAPESSPLAEAILARRAELPASGPAAADAGMLPTGGHHALWERLCAGPGYLRRGDGAVVAAPAAAAGCVAESVPDRIHLHWRPAAGAEAVGELLAAAGEALAWAHLPASAPAEDRLLAADGGAAIYGRAWARAALRPGWWRTLGLTGTRVDEAVRLARRRQGGRLLDLAGRVAGGRPAPPGPGWEWLDEQPGPVADAWARLNGAPEAAPALADERVAALLEHALARRWGEGWTWDRRAADLLRQLWSEAWARPVDELLWSLDEEDADGELLLADLAPVR